MSEFKIGDGVVYRSYPGGPAEDGVVTRLSSNPSLVFVRYASQHPGADGQATPKVNLSHLGPPDPARAGDTSGDAKGCGWCGLGAGHTTDEHLARWGNPDTAAAPVSGVAARAKGETDDR